MPFAISKFLCVVALMATLSVRAEGLNGEPIPEMLWRDFKSPVTTDAKYYLGGSTALTLVIFLNDRTLDQRVQEDIAVRKPLGSWHKFGDYGGQGIANALYVLGAWALQENQEALLMARASLMAVAFTTVLKPVVGEPRPDDPNHHDSFPSGHATAAFAFASVIGTQHHWAWGVAAYSFAAFVGFSRINDNAHVLHDVIAGATIGTVYGLGISWRDQARSANAWNWLPMVAGGAPGITAGREF